ncbi:NAD-binding Rossmann fold oxidoreductase [Laetiporus sulphureus 93-53]|uniref:NAD-binding Rossmann fold oxidoreductase n=1 Tax=Laetiporus sulphureus 93-53 TaxID=1314785 RepID=A0A165DVR2_9APHY|nr:NAD-binding Rossmann fold oxidoreductase [Laetiporus sulphureus 93-53]KZT05727.1 NAD-binding Rossmann fold oxidoreductase [Laetiporus sulphureus 93-53]
MPIRIGFVGLSVSSPTWAARMLAPPLLTPPLSSAYALSAVSTSSPTSAAASAEKYSELAHRAVKAYHGPTTAIAADPDLDMVAVSVKPSSHMAAVLPVIEAGKDLFVEWPAGRNLHETFQMAEAAGRKGIRTMVGLQGRQSPTFNKVKTVIDSGEIGRVLSTSVIVRVPCDRPLYTWGPYVSENGAYSADATQGATLLEIVVGHFLSVFTYVLGPFTSVSATLAVQHPTAELVDAEGKPTGKTIPQTAANQVAFSGTLASGAVASLHWRGGLEGKPGRAGTPFMWVIDGERGSVRLDSDDPAGCYVQVREPTLYLNGEEVKVEQDGLTNLTRAWAEFAKGQGGSYATLDDALKIKVLLDNIGESSREGVRIEF